MLAYSNSEGKQLEGIKKNGYKNEKKIHSQ